MSMEMRPAGAAQSTRAKVSNVIATPAASSWRTPHRGLARRRVAVCRRAVLMVPKGERPHPRRTDRRGGCLHDPTHRDAVGEHVEVIIVLVAGGSVNRRDCVETRP